MSIPQITDPAEFWEDRYRSDARVWSGNPNPLLVREAAGLAPGTALDLGCGEGGDVLWLAARGWRVTGVDISATALERAAAHAAEAGFADRVAFERHELGVTFPQGGFDLVSAQFLQSPVALDQDGVLKRAAGAVAPGGTLLIGMHGGWPTWMEKHEHPFDADFPTLQGVLTALDLPDTWRVDTLEAVERPSPSPEGKPGTRADNVWRLTRTV
ncbi:class I SAM-dependent methyltransferase [Streptomyces uncialis]|uniref:class I SAM-dependent methyltransferase n=1 Tax=Streptomyces uncialis TaxID=1048205 RepID=UPI0022579A38|nr:methyltransferase domain-containing protein [Streptomyces uncialis]MCX4664764.1 methyltransferase domain-containing protein [Streptomyces uncialis]